MVPSQHRFEDMLFDCVYCGYSLFSYSFVDYSILWTGSRYETAVLRLHSLRRLQHGGISQSAGADASGQTSQPHVCAMLVPKFVQYVN